MINKVEIASVNTAKLPVLTNKEKNELLVKIKNGDNEAREEFINGNLRLVLSIIQRFNGRGEEIDDLFQVGCVGLIKAIDNFDMNLNVQFSTYAVPMIIGEIRRHLRDNNPIRVSRSMRDLAYKALQTKERLFKEKQQEPTIEERVLSLESSSLEVIATTFDIDFRLCEVEWALEDAVGVQAVNLAKSFTIKLPKKVVLSSSAGS